MTNDEIIKLNAVGAKAIEIMQRHGLDNWNFAWHNKKTSLGTCYHTSRKIALSKPHTLINSEEEIIDTILHEVAHALVGYRHAHDNVWRAKAIEIGCNGNRTGGSRLEGVYKAQCPTCGYTSTRHRQTSRHYHCSNCFRKVEREMSLLVFKKTN